MVITLIVADRLFTPSEVEKVLWKTIKHEGIVDLQGHSRSGRFRVVLWNYSDRKRKHVFKEIQGKKGFFVVGGSMELAVAKWEYKSIKGLVVEKVMKGLDGDNPITIARINRVLSKLLEAEKIMYDLNVDQFEEKKEKRFFGEKKKGNSEMKEIQVPKFGYFKRVGSMLWNFAKSVAGSPTSAEIPLEDDMVRKEGKTKSIRVKTKLKPKSRVVPFVLEIHRLDRKKKLRILQNHVKINTSFFVEYFRTKGHSFVPLRILSKESTQREILDRLKKTESQFVRNLSKEHEMISEAVNAYNATAAMIAELPKVYAIFNNAELHKAKILKDQFCNLLFVLHLCSIKKSQEVVIRSVLGSEKSSFLNEFIPLRRNVYEKSIHTFNSWIDTLPFTVDHLKLDHTNFDYFDVLSSLKLLIGELNRSGSIETFVISWAFLLHVFAISSLMEDDSTGNPYSEKQCFSSILKKTKCKDWDKCIKTGHYDASHKEMFYHPCEFGNKCPKMKDEHHMHRFTHPCLSGPRCRDKSKLHHLLYSHDGKYAGKHVRGKENEKNVLKHRKKKPFHRSSVLTKAVALINFESFGSSRRSYSGIFDESSKVVPKVDKIVNQIEQRMKSYLLDSLDTLGRNYSFRYPSTFWNLTLFIIGKDGGKCFGEYSEYFDDLFIRVENIRMRKKEIQVSLESGKFLEEDIATPTFNSNLSPFRNNSSPRTPSGLLPSVFRNGKRKLKKNKVPKDQSGVCDQKYIKIAYLAGCYGYKFLSPLQAPLQDLREMEKLLKKQNFEIMKYDSGEETFSLLEHVHEDFPPFLKKHKDEAKKTKRKLFVLFYFSGHGCYSDRTRTQYFLDCSFDQFLSGIRKSIREKKKYERNQRLLWKKCLSLPMVKSLFQIEKGDERLVESSIILDCCRNPPPSGSILSAEDESKSFSLYKGLVCYAVGDGEIARGKHGDQECSYFTAKLLKTLRTKENIRFSEILNETRKDVCLDSRVEYTPELRLTGIDCNFVWKRGQGIRREDQKPSPGTSLSISQDIPQDVMNIFLERICEKIGMQSNFLGLEDSYIEKLAKASIDKKSITKSKIIKKGARSIVSSGMWNETKVCLKEICWDYVSDEKERKEARKQALNEVAIMKKLSISPHLCLMYGHYFSKSSVTLVLERLDLDLWSYNQKYYSKMNPYRHFKMMKQMAIALAFTHRKGLIHRDVRAVNFLVKAKSKDKIGDVEIKLADFGVSILIDANTSAVNASFKGHPRWLPYECHLNQDVSNTVEFSKCSDVYSLAMSYSELLLNRTPFDGHELVEKNKSKGEKFIEFTIIPKLVSEKVRPDITKIPKEFQLLLKSMWKDNPRRRMSMSQVVKWFRENQDLFKTKYGASKNKKKTDLNRILFE